MKLSNFQDGLPMANELFFIIVSIVKILFTKIEFQSEKSKHVSIAFKLTIFSGKLQKKTDFFSSNKYLINRIVQKYF